MNGVGARALSCAGGLLLDRAFGEPPSALHPVAWFGRLMQQVESVLWEDRRSPGVVYALCGTLTAAGVGRLSGSTTASVGLCVAGRELRAVAHDIEGLLLAGQLEQARQALPALVGRDPSALDESGIAAAVVESLAENSVDAVLAPVLWGLLLGAPGAAAYRAVNTMDAMVGHRGERYGRFGWASARLDDVANYVPARLFAALVALVRPRTAYRVGVLVRRDAAAHPSPNAGVAETAVAAALGRELGGPLRYGRLVEDRRTLGEGPRPGPADIGAAIRLTDGVELASLALLVALWATSHTRRPR